MNVYEAMLAAKDGKKVRCKEWNKSEFCTFNFRGYLMDEYGKSFQLLHTSHILGEWELYPEPVTKEEAMKALKWLEEDPPFYGAAKAEQAAIVRKYLEQV